MADLEMHQVRIRLTKDRDVLNALRSKKQFKVDAGGEYISMQFNSQELRFHNNEVKTLGHDVAHSLYRRSAVIVGDDLTGEMKSIFDIVEEFDLSQKLKSSAQFACPICSDDQGSAKGLRDHLKEHVDSDEEPSEVEDAEEPATNEAASSPVVQPARLAAKPKANAGRVDYFAQKEAAKKAQEAAVAQSAQETKVE